MDVMWSLSFQALPRFSCVLLGHEKGCLHLSSPLTSPIFLMLTSTLINRVHLSTAASHFTFLFFSMLFFSRFSFPCVFFLTNSHIFKIPCYSKLLLSYMLLMLINFYRLSVILVRKKKRGYLENALVEISNYYIPYGMQKIKLDYKILYLSQC